MKILLFDDHRIFGESLSKLLEDWDEISICRYVSNETEFLEYSFRRRMGHCIT